MGHGILTTSRLRNHCVLITRKLINIEVSRTSSTFVSRWRIEGTGLCKVGRSRAKDVHIATATFYSCHLTQIDRRTRRLDFAIIAESNSPPPVLLDTVLGIGHPESIKRLDLSWIRRDRALYSPSKVFGGKFAQLVLSVGQCVSVSEMPWMKITSSPRGL